MALIQLVGDQAEKYKRWLQEYTARTGTEPTASERTEAFFCATGRSKQTKPSWVLSN